MEQSIKPQGSILLRRAIFATILMISVAFYLHYMRHGEEVPPPRDLAAFPKQLGPWSGVESAFDQQVYEVLGVDDSILINYHGPENQEIQVYVGYYQSQRQGNLIHSPRHCMPGSGWDITESEIVNIHPSPREKKGIKVIQLKIEKGLQKQIVLYWFQSRGRFIASEYLQKIFLVWDAIFKNRTDGAFVRLLAPVGEKGDAYTVESLKRFASELLPILTEFLPGTHLPIKAIDPEYTK